MANIFRFIKKLLHYTIFFPHEAIATEEQIKQSMSGKDVYVICEMCGEKHLLNSDDGSVWYITVPKMEI